MTTKTEKAPDTAQTNICRHFLEFKEFLVKNSSTNNDNLTTTTTSTSAITRSNNETYPINATTEFNAEILLTLWNQLQLKKCPEHFQLGIIHHLKAELQAKNFKENDIIAINNTAGENVKQLQYDLVKLQKFVSNSLEKFLIRLNDNAEAQNLRSYADENSLCEAEICQCQISESCTEFTPKRFVVGAIKNKPRKMEDRHVCLARFSELYSINKSGYSFYGVFDGHSGPLAASYATSQLPYLLAKQLKETQACNADEHHREAFEAAFLETDKKFIEKQISSGTTAVCALINETETEQRNLYVAWVGDSRALIVGKDASLQLVKSHKPDSTDERRRIEEAGGSVMFVQGQFRVNGFLNVARSIGDYAVGAVIAEPDFVDVPLSSAHDFLVLGSDGLFDHVTEAAIIATIYESLNDDVQILEDIPKKLIEMAKEGDSQDNITVVIVFLKSPSEILSDRRKS